MEPLEPRQLLSVAIEMAIQQNSNTPAYVLINGSTVNASLGDTFTVDMYVTISNGETNDTLAGYTLNFVGTNASISLDQWARNKLLFPDNTNLEIFGFYDDGVSDSRVNAGLLGAPLTTTTNSWFLGSLNITLPDTTAGSYALTLSTTDNDNPTNITHQLTPELIETTPDINSLTFDLLAGPTATIQSVTSPTKAVIDTLDVTFANIAPSTVALADFTLTRGGSNMNLATSAFGVELDNAGDSDDQTYQLTGLSDAGVLGTDGDYVLTLDKANVATSAGVTLSSDVQVTFTIDRTAPATTIDVLSTDDRTPQLTGTIDDPAATISVTVTHATTGATQTFSATNNGGGTWTLADNTLGELFGGTYDVQVVATDALGNQSDVTTNSALVILDVYDKAPANDDTSANAVALGSTFQRDLSIHETSDVDWKSFTLSSPANILVRAIIPNGEDLKVELFAANDLSTVLETFTSASGQINTTTSTQYPADSYLLKITGNGNDLVTDYDFVAGDASLLAQVEGRYLFYNNSYFDTSTSEHPGFNDTTAIATDKVALLPGEIAGTTNVSSYIKGINGIMIDVLGLASNTLTTDDFVFRAGNSNSPSDWTNAPSPTSIVVQAGQGVSSSDRIVLIWNDAAITKSWLEIQLLATAQTGLAELDSFFFGNAVGDSMTSETNFNVNASDRGDARDNGSGLSQVGVDSHYDFNRDSLVNASDRGIARDNTTGFSPILNLDLTNYDPVPTAMTASMPPLVAANSAAPVSDVELLALALANESETVHLTVIVNQPDNVIVEPTNSLYEYLN